jgi:Flp pilus assembly protein CpaB
MRKSGRILFVLGFVLAAFSALGLYWILINTKPPPPTVPTSKLVIAFQPVTERSEIAADQIGLVDWPQTVPTPTGAYDSSSEVIGKLAKTQIAPGQPILADMLLDKSKVNEFHSNAALILDERTRAIALPVKVDTSVAQAVQAGDRVDLVVTFHASTTSSQQESGGAASGELVVTHHLMQDVLVLQVGPWPNSDAPNAQNSRQADENNYTVVTLQLNLQDAEVLKFAQLNAADVSLALRRANDHSLEETEPVTLEYINKRFGYGFPSSGK